MMYQTSWDCRSNAKFVATPPRRDHYTENKHVESDNTDRSFRSSYRGSLWIRSNLMKESNPPPYITEGTTFIGGDGETHTIKEIDYMGMIWFENYFPHFPSEVARLVETGPWVVKNQEN